MIFIYKKLSLQKTYNKNTILRKNILVFYYFFGLSLLDTIIIL